MNKVYGELAGYYDQVHSDKDYEREVEIVHGIIQQNKKTKGNSLLDAACGTGKHIEFLKAHYDAVGIDFNPEMLRIARRNNPGVDFIEGDMQTFDCNRKFDAITCLFSSISYLTDKDKLRKAIGNFSKHLEPGGVLVMETSITKEEYHPKHENLLVSGHRFSFINRPGARILRLLLYEKKGDRALLNFFYLVNGMRFYRDRHELGLFEKDDYLEVMKENGLEGRALGKKFPDSKSYTYVGIKRQGKMN